VDSAPFTFDEAERFGPAEYRQAVGAAQDTRSVLAAQHEQFFFTDPLGHVLKELRPPSRRPAAAP
jgi:hypothetical protein